NALAAKSALVLGPILFYLLNFSFGDAFQGLLQQVFGLSEPLHFLHTLAIVFVLTLLLLFGLSLRNPGSGVAVPIAETPAHAQMDLAPWRHVRSAAMLISVLTLAFYIALAQ